MKKLNFKLILILLLTLLLSGCYGKVELDNYAYVIAIGVDAPSGDNTKEVIATYQIALPVKLAGESSETGKEVFTTYTVTAKSLEEGNSKLNTISSKEINLSHTKIIVYSEELAKKGLQGHINSFISNTSIRPKTIVAVCKNEAKDFLEKITPVMESSPARYYEEILTSFNHTSRLAGTEILNFYTSSKANYKSAIAVIAKLEDEKSGKFSGIAVFKDLKMVGEINEDLVISHLMLTNSLSQGTICVDDIYEPSNTVSLTVKQSKAPKINVDIKDNVPYIDIEIFLDINLDSDGGDTNYLEDKNKEKLRNELSKEIVSLVNDYLKKTVEFDTDIAGFGRYAKINKLTWKEFEDIKWEEIYKKSIFNVKPNINLNVAQIVSHMVKTD